MLQAASHHCHMFSFTAPVAAFHHSHTAVRIFPAPVTLLIRRFSLLLLGDDFDICEHRPERVKNATKGTGRGFA